jgi:aryl-alcohol dehydrogenase-like predicted oxidoreductase
VLATKFWGQMGEDPNRGGVSRRWIIHEVESSLLRLNTDSIDLYQVHRWLWSRRSRVRVPSLTPQEVLEIADFLALCARRPRPPLAPR